MKVNQSGIHVRVEINLVSLNISLQISASNVTMHNFYFIFTIAAWVFTVTANPNPNPVPQVSSDLPPGSDENNSSEGNINNGDNEDASEDLESEIIVVANNQRIPLPVPPVGSRAFRYSDLPYTVEEARVESAPAGIGCFFVSNPQSQSSPGTSSPSTRRTRPSGFSRSSRPSRSSSRSSSSSSDFSWAVGGPGRNTYVSPTFYSSGSAEAGENLVFSPPFVNVGSLSCFRLPVNDQKRVDENTIAILVDLRSPSGEAISMPGLEGLASEITHFEPMSLVDIDNSVKGAGFAFGNTSVIMTRAAIVHAPPALASSMTCRLIALVGNERLRFADFSIARQLETPIPDIRFLICQDSPYFDMSGYREAGLL